MDSSDQKAKSLTKTVIYIFAGLGKNTQIDAATVILKELWKRLRETHKLRVMK